MILDFNVTILGYNSAVPTAHSHPTAQLVDVKGTTLLIDCGEGTQIQIRKSKTKFSKLNQIFISHLHGDHVFGLVGLISTLQLLGRNKSLEIFGPVGIKNFINHQLSLTNAYQNFELIFHELNSDVSELIFENKKLKVYTIPLRHRFYCNGFLIQEKEGLRHLNMQAILQIPEIETCDYYKIKQGFDFVRANGEVIPCAKLTFPPEPARSYAFCSDTMYHPAIVPIIENVDLLYHEATFSKALKNLAKKTGHSTAEQAAQIAKQAQVSKLIIGHFSNRYKNPQVLLDEAKEIFAETYLPKTLESISIPQKKL